MKLLAIIIVILSGIVLAACNLPGSSGTAGSPEMTAAAQTVQAELTSQGITPTPLSILTRTSTASLKLNDNTNCRAGPGTSFEKLTVIPEGTTVPILARSSDGNYFLVDPADISESCWVLGELGAVVGDVGSVPLATPAAEASSGAPNRPGNWDFTYECPFGSLTTNITWSDSANNENGYRIYRNGVPVVELPANSTQYVDITDVSPGSSVNYTIEAFNDAGSGVRTFSFKCE